MNRPVASSPAARDRMRRQARRNTDPEVQLRKELHRRGLRYRTHRRLLPGLRRTIDIVFGPAKVAVEVRGCFWHGCPEHATWPKANSVWWDEKLSRNRERDVETERELAARGWRVVIVWEHEAVREAAERVETIVKERRGSPRQA